MHRPITRLYERYFSVRRQLAASVVAPPPPPAPLQVQSVRRLLLVCTGLLGDTVMCLPAMAKARSLFPTAEIVGLVNETARGLLALTAVVDRVIVTDGAPLRLLPQHHRAARTLQAALAAESFDLAVIFLGDDYAPMLTRIGIPHRIFVAESAYSRLATASYSIGAPRTWGPQERLSAWAALQLPSDALTVTLRPTAQAAAWAAALAGAAERQPLLVIHPFGRTLDQWWPHGQLTSFLALAERELGAVGYLVGNQQQAARVEPAWLPARNLAGRLSIDELAALLSNCACVVTTDSGPMHLAGALGVPTVALFRGHRPEHATRYSSLEPIVAPTAEGCDACRWDDCRFTPCREMLSIQPEAVLNAVRRQLHRGSSVPKAPVPSDVHGE